jgi:hypothetical protein
VPEHDAIKNVFHEASADELDFVVRSIRREHGETSSRRSRQANVAYLLTVAFRLESRRAYVKNSSPKNPKNGLTEPKN